MGENNLKPAIISVSSHVARGSVGNRAAVFALEAFGFPVWAVPTVILPWHPGHGPSQRIIPKDVDFDKFIKDITHAPWVDEIGAILTGYIADASQVKTIAQMILSLKSENPDIVYACDPVIGDHGNIYVKEQTAVSVREQLIPLADVITPNAFELAWLAGYDQPATIEAIVDIASGLGEQEKLITSVPASSRDHIGNLYLHQKERWLANHARVKNPPNGTGDLTAAIFLARKLSGATAYENLKATSESVFEILKLSIDQKRNELTLENNVASLLKPKTKISLSKLEIRK